MSRAAQPRRIRDFHSDIHLLDDGTLLVKETITVFSTGNLIRHGIYREFPTRYEHGLGNNYAVGFHWLGALCDGYSETSRVEDSSNGVRIYLGDQESYINRGDHTYELNYSANRQLGFFSDHDELFWNVTGNGWAFRLTTLGGKIFRSAQLGEPSAQFRFRFARAYAIVLFRIELERRQWLVSCRWFYGQL